MEHLTTAQQFQLQMMKNAAQNMSKEQACELAIQATKLLMVKTNIYRSFAKHSLSKEGLPNE